MKLSTLLAVAFAAVVSQAQATNILVPAYFYPSFNPAISQWDDMTAALATGAQITAIMNVNNGPGGAPNADYVAAVNAFKAAGGQVIGYIHSCYATTCAGTGSARTAAELLQDAQRYADWYGVQGVFVDEMSNRLADLSYYTGLASDLRAAHPGWFIVGNPGVATPQDYLAAADTLVTFEGAAASYASATSLPWMASSDPSRQAHLLYNTGGISEMQSLLAAAQARRAGWVYITDDRYTPGNPAEPNPWDQLPSFFAAEAAAVAAVPELNSGWLLGAGLLLGTIARHARLAPRPTRRRHLLSRPV